MILLDTHVLVWLAEGNVKLGKRARRSIDEALHASGVGVATVSYWEIAMLAQKGRLELPVSPAAFRRRVIGLGVRELPLQGGETIRAAELTRFHGDPADRMIAATAIEIDATLCTADKPILKWKGELRTLDASR